MGSGHVAGGVVSRVVRCESCVVRSLADAEVAKLARPGRAQADATHEAHRGGTKTGTAGRT